MGHDGRSRRHEHDLSHQGQDRRLLPRREQDPQLIVTSAIEGVTCSVTLPEHFAGEGTCSVVVPYVRGVDTFLMGVQGYDEKVAITKDVTVTKAMVNKFWIGHTAQEGYVIANPDTAQWHIDFGFATGPQRDPVQRPERAAHQPARRV